MSETAIKLASNPYSKSVEFFRQNNGWEHIDAKSDPNSKLLSKDLTEGFFPFKAKEIVNRILDEYQACSEAIHILFEGSEDEYEELCAICSSDEYRESVSLERGERSLANARDVLPEIVNVFRSIRPLVDETIHEKDVIERELDKFCDVSSDLIPLCVLGNYSAGKSTFINALIGYELLPNGDMPVTAKVFQITRSKQRDRARISFDYNGDKVTLRFNANGINSPGDLLDDPLFERLTRTLEPVEGMIPQMNASLQIINSYKPKNGSPGIDDLIEIEVPFCMDDPWALSHEFVIFDTPGSNSASNEDHVRVLRKAMDGLSNGLPIYIAEYSSLDSTDNEKLYDEIKEIEAMDDRFAMIVVNKADSAELPKGCFGELEVEQIMDMAIPRNLYAQGIYFVSSILGLGSKTHGEFASDNYAEKYEDQERKYSNPDNRFYKMLYRYNILPGQIGQRTTAESECCPDLVFANSGLYCVEREIALFAERYSAYNKCHQSEALLKRIIEITSNQIRAKEEECRSHKADLEQALEDDKAKLLKDLEACGEEVKSESTRTFPSEVTDPIIPDRWFKSPEQLKTRETALCSESMNELGFTRDREEAKEAKRAVGENLGKRLGDALSSPSLDAFGDAIKGLVDDIDESKSKSKKARSTERKAETEMSENLLEEVKRDFEERLEDINATIDGRSREYWEAKAEEGREALYQLATNSTVLSDEKRKQIADIIIQYPALTLRANIDEIFDRSKFDGLWLLSIIFQSTRLNLSKLSRTFNSEVETALKKTKEAIRSSHESSFNDWLKVLLNRIRSNITEYNPVLNRHVKLIDDDERKILELTRKLDTLQRCTTSVTKMIDWRE